jgi:hypothetical protein
MLKFNVVKSVLLDNHNIIYFSPSRDRLKGLSPSHLPQRNVRTEMLIYDLNVHVGDNEDCYLGDFRPYSLVNII